MGTQLELHGSSSVPLEVRPGVFLIGAPNVGKRTLLSRLLSVDVSETADLSSGVVCHGWTIDTKYYSAELSIWTANLTEDFSFAKLPSVQQISALVMVFDMSDESSFVALQNWISCIDIKKFDVLLCVGNKADLIPGHRAHREYRRRLQRHGESASDPHSEFFDYGIDETEGFSLLGEEQTCLEIFSSCLDWCSQHSIEFIEACVSNADFDKCLSVDGDIQGVERIHGALSAHLWPGMVLKSGNSMGILPQVSKEETTDESDFEAEYELLSGPVDEPRDGRDIFSNPSGEASGAAAPPGEAGTSSTGSMPDATATAGSSNGKATSAGPGRVDTAEPEKSDRGTASNGRADHHRMLALHSDPAGSDDDDYDDTHFLGLDDLEKLMGEMANIRSRLSLMPDSQRRETAAGLAVKVAAMLGDESDEGDGF